MSNPFPNFGLRSKIKRKKIDMKSEIERERERERESRESNAFETP